MKLEVPKSCRSQCKCPPEGMLVEICTPGGSLCSVTADCHSHIADIKNQIETATGIPRWEQRLISGQDQLRDGDFLNSIGKGALNLLLLRRDSEQAHWLKTFVEDDEDLHYSSRWESFTSLRDAPEKIRSDREVVAAAVRSRGSNLIHASKELRGDKGLALLAIESIHYPQENVGCNDNGVFMHLSDELRADREVVAAALEEDATSEHMHLGFAEGGALRRASETLRNDEGFVLEAVRRFGSPIHDAPRHLREDADVILTALRHHPHMELGGCKCRGRGLSPGILGIECAPQLRCQKEFVLKAAHLGQFNFVLSSSHNQWHDSANQNWANDEDFMQQLAPLLYPLYLPRDEPIDYDMHACLACQGSLSTNYTCIRDYAPNGEYHPWQAILEAAREMGTMLGMLLRRKVEEWKEDAKRKMEESKEDARRVELVWFIGSVWDDVYNRKQILEEARMRKWFRDSAWSSRSKAKKQRSLNSQVVGWRGGRHKVPDIDFWDL